MSLHLSHAVLDITLKEDLLVSDNNKNERTSIVLKEFEYSTVSKLIIDIRKYFDSIEIVKEVQEYDEKNDEIFPKKELYDFLETINELKSVNAIDYDKISVKLTFKDI